MKAIFLAGLGFGDEGKGTMTEAYGVKNDCKTVIRYNGGPQTAHNVVMKDGRHHTFSQFGSGTIRGMRTFLSKYMLINPLSMVNEAKALENIGVKDPFKLMDIDRNALLITTYHRAANRFHEMARKNPHGSVGLGIGEARKTQIEHPDIAPTIGDLLSFDGLVNKLRKLQELKITETDIVRSSIEYSDDAFVQKCNMLTSTEDVDKRLRGEFLEQGPYIVDSDYITKAFERGNVIFEGAQGILLDETYGLAPHVTWTNITFDNAYSLIRDVDINEEIDITRVGVIRSYMTRHGHGPFISEIKDPDEELFYTENHNKFGRYQGAWRVGRTDIVSLHYALDVIGDIDELAVTHMDIVNKRESVEVCTAYEIDDGELWSLSPIPNPSWEEQIEFSKELNEAKPIYEKWESRDFLENLNSHISQNIAVTSHGPTFEDKKFRD